MRRATVPLVLLAALSLFAGLGRGAITDADEAFYAESAREMVASGDWLTPHYNFEPRFQKPALYYWLTAIAYLVLGQHEFSARLWSAAAALGIALVAAACARRWFDEATALLAGAMTLTSLGSFAIARMALPDLPLAFSVTLTIWAAFMATLERDARPRPWLLLAAAASALGFLAKGPVALVIPALVVTPVVLIERRSLNIRASDALAAALVFAVIAVPWYLAMSLRHGAAYLEGFFIGDNLERFATTRFNEPRPWWFYAPVLAGGLLPWTPLVLVWGSPVAQFVRRRRDVGTLDLRLLLWAMLPLVLFTVSVGKQPRYILPVLPPVVILLASSIVERTREWRSLDGARRRPRPSWAVVVGCVAAGLLMTTLAGLLYRARELFVDVSESSTITAATIMAVAGASVLLVSPTRGWRAGPAMVAIAGAVICAALPYGVLASTGDAAVERMAARVRAERVENQPVATYGVFVRNLVYYTHVPQTDLINDDHAVDWLSAHARALIVLPAEDAERLARQRGVRFERLFELRYFDEGSIRPGTLLWPSPDEDVMRVLLVRARE